jgi:hypothetical protein
MLRRSCGWRVHGEKDVNFLVDQVLSKFCEPLRIAIGEADVQSEVPAFDVAERFQTFFKGRDERLTTCLVCVPKHAYYSGCFDLLRKRAKRRSDDRRHDHNDSSSAYHSITLSARSRIDCGIVMPRAFAVLTLTASSNLVDCSIGKSPGLAPLRILST